MFIHSPIPHKKKELTNLFVGLSFPLKIKGIEEQKGKQRARKGTAQEELETILEHLNEQEAPDRGTRMMLPQDNLYRLG